MERAGHTPGKGGVTPGGRCGVLLPKQERAVVRHPQGIATPPGMPTWQLLEVISRHTGHQQRRRAGWPPRWTASPAWSRAPWSTRRRHSPHSGQALPRAYADGIRRRRTTAPVGAPSQGSGPAVTLSERIIPPGKGSVRPAGGGESCFRAERADSTSGDGPNDRSTNSTDTGAS